MLLANKDFDFARMEILKNVCFKAKTPYLVSICEIISQNMLKAQYFTIHLALQIHFEPDDWVKNKSGEKVLRDDVLPTLNLHGEAIKSWITLDKSGSVKDELVRSVLFAI